MNIRQALSDEHSKSRTMKIVAYIGDDQERFAELMEIFLGDEYRLTQQAAWVVNYCGKNKPQLIAPYFDKLLDSLQDKNKHPAVRRNVVRLLQYVEIPLDLFGKVYSHCVDLIDDATEPVAVRAFALTVAAKIAKGEPELQRELQLIVKKHLRYTSAAFHKRAREILTS